MNQVEFIEQALLFSFPYDLLVGELSKRPEGEG